MSQKIDSQKIAIISTILVAVLLVVGITAVAQTQPAERINCTAGMADVYPCKNVDLLAHMPLSAIGAEDETVKGSDHWGWTDPETGRDYVLFTLTNGISFIDITDRHNPVYLGKLSSHVPGEISTWWDVKVYQNVAYIIGDVPTNNGLQMFDLTQLRDVQNPPVMFSETAHYDGFGPGHNLWINEESGYLYLFRTDVCQTITIFNLANPLAPQPEGPAANGCFVDEPVDEIVSDGECVNYRGLDADYQGREICFIGSDATLSVADVTDKAAPVVITGTLKYPGIRRAHQGVLTEDQRFWLVSDVMDEPINIHNTRTYLWDMADLDQPSYLGFYESSSPARDHNVYIVDHFAIQTNWNAGLRILDLRRLPETHLQEVAYFDIVPETDSPSPDGAWSNYPWWDDGVVTVSGTKEGLFILQPRLNQQFLSVIFGS
ncbi:MAG: choice-of-anchor B family protein [Chloroflexota bacterium]